jgi:hypothetical protein
MSARGSLSKPLVAGDPQSDAYLCLAPNLSRKLQPPYRSVVNILAIVEDITERGSSPEMAVVDEV